MTTEPRVIADYELLDKLGSGAAGAAYRARNTTTGEMVALKLVHAEHSTHEEIQKRFVREVAVLERLSHPNIVAHRDCGLSDDAIYFAMELVDAGPLSKVLKARQVLSWREAVEVAAQVCDALDHAHQNGVIHRDLKPANLFLSDDGLVKVGDFGLARDLGRHRLTIEGHTVGTVLYMAPEQVRGADELTGGVDLYAIGCLLYQMIAGRAPYLGSSAVEVMEQHLTADPPKLVSTAPGTPEPVSRLVERLLSKTAEERGASAALVRDELRAILNGDPLPQPAPIDRETEDAADDASDAPNLTQRLKTGGTQPKKANPAVVVGFVVAILGALIALFLASR